MLVVWRIQPPFGILQVGLNIFELDQDQHFTRRDTFFFAPLA